MVSFVQFSISYTSVTAFARKTPANYCQSLSDEDTVRVAGRIQRNDTHIHTHTHTHTSALLWQGFYISLTTSVRVLCTLAQGVVTKNTVTPYSLG